eukprot:TRINITY_DN4344_c0_g1_i2.p2 TRINITY_DN4344_c0_g1~~TRINITY_DN4344_c0_g1_i2.p2  ORF type:complete len:101 (+),score=42.04 TRINITY_DN4344_c0_g1_i2:106-408(+)
MFFFFFFLMIRRPPRSTHCISSAASDVYKRQVSTQSTWDHKSYLLFKTEKNEKASRIYAQLIQIYQYFQKKNSKNIFIQINYINYWGCLLYTSPSPRDQA